MRPDLVRRVVRPSQPPKKKRANRRKSVSRQVLSVFPTLDRPFCSTWLCKSLLKVCAIIRPFFSSRTICEFREFSTVPAFHGPFLCMVVSFFCPENLKEIFMKIKVLSLVFAAVMLSSLSASAAIVHMCCGNPTCCDGGTCCE